jgi:hypothetical protein
MAKRHGKQKQHEDQAAAAEKPTQRGALAEALRHLGRTLPIPPWPGS